MNNFKRNNRNKGKRRDFKERRFFGSGRDRERPQMHEATCSACGKRCEVPFRPTGQKPVYCNECFRGHEKRDSGFKRPSFRKDSFQGKREGGFGKEEFNRLMTKLDTIISILSAKEGTGESAKKTKKNDAKKIKKEAPDKT